MRKKRKMTKTTMVKKLFLFLAITAGLLTSCKDYDDDIDGLNEDIAALQTALGTANTDLSTLKTQIAALPTTSAVNTAVNAAKTEAVNQAKTQTEALIDALKGGSTKTIKALETDLTALTASLQVLQVQVGTLATTAQLDAAKLDIAANKAAIALQQAVLDKYLLVPGTDNVVGKITDIQKELTDLLASTEEEHAAMQAAIDAIEAKIVAIDAKLDVLNFAAVNSMVTEITFVYSPLTNILLTQSLDYTTAIAKTSDWFGDSSWSSAIKFTAGQRFLADESSIIVKVEPANADLSKKEMLDKIYLISSDENNEINKYIKAVSATRYTGLLTRGATPTGLWEITFELPATSDLSAVAALTRSNGRPVLFAVAIESSVVENESRFVVSEFGASISVGDKDPVYNDDDFRSTIGRENDLTFSVKLGTEDEDQYINYRNIRNRYAESETHAIVPKDQKWEPGHWTAAKVVEDDPADNRLGKDLFAVEANTVFNVKLNNPEAVYAYYVVLDEAYATESAPSEINAWKSYTYNEGFNKVYKADEVAELKVISTSANGDIIGFRVYAVNYDGTLVDPDGKSFYVYVGEETSSKLEFTQTITSYINSVTTAQSTDVVPFTPVSNVTTATLSMTIGHSKALSLANLKLMKADNSTTANWSEVTKIQIIDVAPSDLNEGALYEGTLTLKNSSGVVINTTTITLRKVLPEKYVNTGITYKTSIHHNVNGYEVIFGYPNPADNSYVLATALNFPASFDYGKLKVINKATNAGLTWTAGGTSGTVSDNVIGSANIYDLDLGYSYGYCKYDGNQYYAPWEAPKPIKVQFHSYVQDLTDWTLNDAPALIWGNDYPTYGLTKVKAQPPTGSIVDMKNIGTLTNGAKYQVTAVKLLTGADVVNEYFVPTLENLDADSGYDNISFEATDLSQPSDNVPTKMVVTVKDLDFDHEYTFEVPATFPMKFHN